MSRILSPASRPCGSCPYRKDVPSGVWANSEYLKLPGYDRPTWDQPTGFFMCHQQDGRACAGWVAVHDMDESMAFRLAAARGDVVEEDVDAFLDYATDVPLFASGEEAAAHGLELVDCPPDEAARMITKLSRRRS